MNVEALTGGVREVRKLARQGASEMFNYKCPECGKGTVREQRKEFEVNFSGIKFPIKDAQLGVCDHCGAENFDGAEYRRWQKLFEKSLQEKQKPLAAVEIARIRKELGLNQRQFAVLIGCTRQSIYNWENPKRRVPQCRQADLMIRLLGVCEALTFLVAQAKYAGVEIPVECAAGPSIKSSGRPTGARARAAARRPDTKKTRQIHTSLARMKTQVDRIGAIGKKADEAISGIRECEEAAMATLRELTALVRDRK